MIAELERINLNYQVFGEGKPVLIFHGYFGISDGMIEIFEPIFRDLDGWKRIYLDSPGNGKSEAPDWIESSDQVLQVVEEFIDRVVPGEDLLLAGYSYGGYLSMGLVSRRPKQIKGVLLVCPLVEPDDNKRHIPSSELRKVNLGFFDSLDAGLRGLLTSGQMGMVVVQPRSFERAERVYTPGHQAANAEFLNRIREQAYSFSFDILQTQFEKPALIITGRQDNSVGYLDAWKLVERFKRASFAVLDAAGHGLPLEQEEVFASLVREWIERVEAFGQDSSLSQTH